jgi:hypothetical protein
MEAIMLNVSFPSSPLEVLNELPEVFYLTGSRFFGTAKKDSDWDFFAQDSHSLVQVLIQLGFKVIALSDYKDKNSALILKMDDVHVQLVKDSALKDRAQKILLESGVMKNTPKTEHTKLWNLALFFAGK